MADLKPHSYGSFSYKALNADIGKSLSSRSTLDNTIQIDMPFVKLTSTIQLPEYLGEGNIGFTLGLHAIDQDVKFEDMYSGQEGADANCPLIGYTYTPEGMTRRIYARPPRSEVSGLINLFDGRKKLLNTTKNLYIPPPGITSVTIGRNKNGLLAHGQINFMVPTLSQLEILHRTFLVPGVGMILEWGNQFAQAYEPTGYNELGDIVTNKKLFPWYDRTELMAMLNRLARRQVGLEEILKDYVYPTHGQYMWMFGRVANFSTIANSDGSFNCTVKIVGPSEDAWAYSVYNTVVPPSDDSGKICAQNIHSVASYFSGTTEGSLNLRTLLTKVISDRTHEWHNHVLRFEKGNNSKGDPEKNPDTSDHDISETTFAENEDAYFMTWKFFVNVVLNDPILGVKQIFKLAGMSDAQIDAKISLLRPYAGSVNGYINDPYEPFVGMHKLLRSVDLSTMFIVNEKAIAETRDFPEYQLNEKNWFGVETDKNAFFTELAPDIKTQLSKDGSGDFNLSTSEFNKKSDPNSGKKDSSVGDRGFLSAGVWVNHKAVVESMLGAETILHGVTTLLNKMSAATCNYWQLVLDASEPVSATDPVKHEYIVIDANYRENSDVAVGEFLDKVYVFNKYARTNEFGELVGSELTDCTVDLSLPKRLFSQIATLGLYRTEDLKTLGIESATAQQSTSMPILSDPNETLRKMFGITSLSANDTAGQGPDLTILPDDERTRNRLVNSTQCNKGPGQTTAETGGNKNTIENSINYAQALANFKNEPQEGLVGDAAFGILMPAQTTLTDLRKAFDNPICQACTTAKPTDPISSPKPTNDAVPQGTVSYTGVDNKTYSVTIVTDSTGDTTASRLLYSAGYRNGQLPNNILSSIGTGHFLYTEVAAKYNEMKAAAKVAGVDLIINASYRTVSKQVSMLQTYGSYGGVKSKSNPNGFGAADPGTSNHGWGLAVDLDLSARGWLLSNARSYGFSPLNNDPVHWTYTGAIAPPKPYAPDTTPQLVQPISLPVATPMVVDVNDVNRVCTAEEITRCNKLADVINRGAAIEAAQSSKEAAFNGLTRKFYNMKGMWRYVEPYPDLMIARIARTADMDASNAFGASPGTLSISADMTLPGINGFRVGELFWIERIPAFYKAFGAFQIISIEDTVGIDGWNTKIHARFNYLGKKWKDSVVRKLQGIDTTGEGE